jgi:hypothetical protein
VSAVIRFSFTEITTTPLNHGFQKLGHVNSDWAFFSPISRTPYVNKTGSRVRGMKGEFRCIATKVLEYGIDGR